MVVCEVWLSGFLDLVEWVAEEFVVLLLVEGLSFNSFLLIENYFISFLMLML